MSVYGLPCDPNLGTNLVQRHRSKTAVRKKPTCSSQQLLPTLFLLELALLKRPEGSTTLSISIPGQVDQHVALPMRGLAECLIEDLRRLDPDEAYAAALAAIFDVEVS